MLLFASGVRCAGLLAGLCTLRSAGSIGHISLGMCVSPDRNGIGDSNAALIIQLINRAPGKYRRES